MPTVKGSGGVEIYYEVRGEGPPLMLISGTGHDHSLWAAQIPPFSAEFRCILVDNRGVGRSGVPPAGYGLADMADDAARVLDDLGEERVHLMGYSMGGHISQHLTLRHPERVMSLGLHHTWSRNCALLGGFQLARKGMAQRGEREALAEYSILGLFSHAYYDAHPEEMETKRRSLMESVSALGWEGQLEACLTSETHGRLGEINAPTLVTASTHDLIVDPHHARGIAEQIPGAKLVIMEGTGHVALVERPEEFTRICLDFLRAL